MKEGKHTTNAQSKRTRKHICLAMKELMQIKPFSDISISTITERAEISRGSFYSHYEKKEDVVRDILQSIIDENYKDSQRENLSVRDGWIIVFRNFIYHRDFLISVGNNNLMYLWQEISMKNYSKITSLYLKNQKLIGEESDLFYYFKIYHGMALPYILYELLKKHPELSAEEMADIILKVRQKPFLKLLDDNKEE